jgi:C_GCAxxG_C_C family probable redox protein
MTTRQEQALTVFASGLNCAQSVVTVYSEVLGFDDALAADLSIGFGGGMGRLQQTCGAMSGAIMVLSLYNSAKYPEAKERKERAYEMVREFNSRFTAMHGASDCRTLLGVDLMTDEGHAQMKEQNLNKTVCQQCVRHAVEIVDDMIK